MNFFVTAIGTDSGKSVVSAILTEYLKADYWKPIQAGEPRDTEMVQRLTSNSESRFYKERYCLETPASPHAAAKIDNVNIRVSDFHPPISNHHLVIEGAGGVMVPINDDDIVIDLATQCNAEIILVSNLYLGSINHTLLTIHFLKSKGYSVRGLIFNGPSNEESERIILAKSNWPCLLRIQQHEEFTPNLVSKYAGQLTFEP